MADHNAELRCLAGELEAQGKRLMDDYSLQLAEFRLSVPVPKKYARFLFVQQVPNRKEES